MNNLKLICNDNLSLVMYPPGKPDKKISQAFKDYNGQKGTTACFLYALKILTIYQDNIYSNNIEKSNLYKYRKSINNLTKINWKRATVINYLNFFATNDGTKLNSVSKEWIKNITKNVIAAIENANNFRPGTKEVAEKFLTSFQNSDILNIIDYNKQIQREEAITEIRKFLQSENLDIDNLIKLKNEFYLKFTPLDKLKDPAFVYHILNEIYIEHVCKLANLFYADWNPAMSIDVLIKIIKENGALLSSGLMGKAFSTNPPITISDDWKNYTVQGWKPGTFNPQHMDSGHFIVLVGASKSPYEVVYFIDPEDKSHMNENRKVYKISYKLFCNTVLVKYGLLTKNKPNQPEIPAYLLYKKT